MSSNENSIILEYIQFYNKYRQIYGKDVVILLEVGSFYEIYSHMSEPNNEYFDIYEIANTLNLTVSKKNNKGEKKNELASLNNYYMCGFPNYIVNKYVNMLVNSNYTVIVVNQRDSENPIEKKKEHYVYEIVSPSTYYNEDININGMGGNNSISKNGNNSCELMNIYIQEIIDRKSKDIKLTCHISMCDIYTGVIKLFEIIDYDIEMTFEELNRLFYYKPKEVVIFGDINKVNIDKQLQVIQSRNFLFLNRINNYNKEILKLSYQNEIIKKVYGTKKIGLLNPIDFIELGNRPDFVTSVCYLFAFLYEHNEKLIHNLNVPIIIEDFTNVNGKHMILVNNAIKDLNIISDNHNELCINKLLNKCQTSIGKRFFNFILKNPLICSEKLEIYYHLTELFQKSEIINTNNEHLKKINDIEKLVRKMKQYKLNPYELAYIKNSLKNFYDLVKYIHMEYKDFELVYKIANVSIDDFNLFNQLIKLFEFFNATFNENTLCKYSLYNITENIFMCNYNKEISILQTKINTIETYYTNLCNDLNKFMNEELVSHKKTKTSKTKNIKNEQKLEQYFKIEVNNKLDNLNRVDIRNQKEFDKYNDIEYYYIYITKTRFDKFKALFKESNSDIKKHIIDTYKFIDFKVEGISNSSTSTNVKLSFTQVNNFGKLLNEYKHQIHELLYTEYNKVINDIIEDYSKLFDISIKFIGIIDYITNNAHNANKYNYIKPVINCEKRNNDDPSYLKIRGLRHPIIEQINNNVEYIPNDIEIGTKNSAVSYLLYGVNTIGKSSLLKSVGISLVMASAGMYTACSYYEFKPYHHIFTHINKSDDIWKNLSLFSSDMLSIKTFLNMMSNKSLILSDELMNSSETESSISILGATINKLVSNNVCHIFTTHFHELRKLSLIRQLHSDGKIRLCYLHVAHNASDGNFIFDRKLRDIDDEHLDLYGLEIAKGLNLPADFLLDANKIRCEVLGINNEIVSTKKSKYNSMVYIDNCGICGSNKNLEVHHILFQSDANDNGFIKSDVVESGNNGIHKNRGYNLIPICIKCHDDIHNGKKNINGFIQSINGVILE